MLWLLQCSDSRNLTKPFTSPLTNTYFVTNIPYVRGITQVTARLSSNS